MPHIVRYSEIAKRLKMTRQYMLDQIRKVIAPQQRNWLVEQLRAKKSSVSIDESTNRVTRKTLAINIRFRAIKIKI